MASSNHTTYFDLSQYSASDKPTYLVDYNGDMSKIDAGLHEADSDAKTAISEIGDLTNLTTTVKSSLVSAINEVDGETAQIGNLSNLTTTANTDLVSAINEVDAEADTNTTAIGTLANLETAVKTNLVGATNEVNSKVGNLSDLITDSKSNTVSAINEVLQKLNLTSVDVSTLNPQYSNCSDAGGSLYFATNSDNSIFKVYGFKVLTVTNSGDFSVSFSSSLRPNSAYAISTVGIAYNYDTGGVERFPLNMTINTNGTITINGSKVLTNINLLGIDVYPCIYFNKSFGDTPTP